VEDGMPMMTYPKV